MLMKKQRTHRQKAKHSWGHMFTQMFCLCLCLPSPSEVVLTSPESPCISNWPVNKVWFTLLVTKTKPFTLTVYNTF